MKQITTFLLVVLAVVMISSSADAQLYLKKAVISSGGATSKNSQMTLGSTAGQTAAGQASNGVTKGEFGFWNNGKGGAVADVKTSQSETTTFSVAANPVSSVLQLRMNLPASSQVNIGLYDVQGRQVRSLYNGISTSANGDLRFDVSAIADGVYFVAVQTAGQLHQQKITVIH